MSSDVVQEVLFQDPIGMRLRRGREKAGLSIEQVGQQLKLPVAIVQAMELDDWARLGAPVYVRSYLGSYLRLVGLPAALADQAALTKQAPPLVARSSSSRLSHALHRGVRNGVYLVMTGLLVVPVYFAARYYQDQDRPELLTLETSPEMVQAQALAASAPSVAAPVAAPPAAAADAALAGAVPAATGDATLAGQPNGAAASTPPAAATDHPPVMASMSPFPSAVAPGAALVLRFKGESWVDVVDAQGARVERGLVAAGAERRYAPGQVARITLGNSDAVDVTVAGRALDLAPYRTANVARFTVSSAGEPAPAGN
jgi:cytoskeleton protein RodZ